VSLERQNALAMFEMKDGAPSPTARFQKDALATPHPKVHQLVGTVHVHPNGRIVYVANRASDTVEYAGQNVFAAGRIRWRCMRSIRRRASPT